MSGLFRRLHSRTAAVAVAAALIAATPVVAAAPALVDLVFYAPHFAKVENGSTIAYRFVRTSEDPKLDPSFEDVVNIKVGPQGAEDSVTVDLFTGARAQNLPNMSKTGNPVIVAMLEQDVKEMQKVLGGSPFYFRNRMRQALTEQKPAEAVKVEYDGKTLDGWKVVVRPFQDDLANKAKLREFSERTYELTFADGLPGGLYALKTVTPKQGVNGSILVEELTLQSTGAAGKAEAPK